MAWPWLASWIERSASANSSNLTSSVGWMTTEVGGLSPENCSGLEQSVVTCSLDVPSSSNYSAFLGRSTRLGLMKD